MIRNFQMILLSLLILIANMIAAQNQGVPQQLTQHINGFTGDLLYQIPLMEVSGPNGESFPLHITYDSRVTVNREASWMGLGWEMDLGEIRREVKGVPDDWNGKSVVETLFDGSTTVTTKNYWGPVHFKELYGSGLSNKHMDLYLTERHLSEATGAFEFPDYDAYHVSGPGMGGEMSPYMFQFADLYHEDETDIDFKSPSHGTFIEFTKRPVFRFKEESAKVLAPHPYGDNFYAAMNNYGVGDLINFVSGFTDPDHADQNSWDYENSTGGNVLWAANYVEYFTNDEIYDHHNSGPQIDGGFFEYSNSVSRTSGNGFDPDGIGAFRVTTPAGITYHYSLPIYVREETSWQGDLDDNFDLNSSGELRKFYKAADYAYTWKLTAITGMDYVDGNSNGIVDEGDQGYWIAINYKKWTKSQFKARNPYYGYSLNVQTDKRIPRFKGTNYKNYRFGGLITDKSTFKSTANVGETNLELYYPYSIQTSSQTAFFVYDIRLDAHSANTIKTPLLRLRDILLIHNKDVNDNNIFSSLDGMTSSDFSSLSTVVNTGHFITGSDLDDFQAPGTDHHDIVLKRVSLSHDYHLAKKLYNNIKNTFSFQSTKGTVFGQDVYDEIDQYTGGSTNNHLRGKLTLNKITFYENEMEQMLPSYDFIYENPLDANDNPDYNYEKSDYFGYYKHNFSSYKGGYLIPADEANIDAWCLRKITQPTGQVIEVEYESDSYMGIGFDTRFSIPEKIERTFVIKNVTSPGDFSNELEIEVYDPDAGVLFNSLDNNEKEQLQFYFKYYCTNSGGTRNTLCTDASSSPTRRLNYTAYSYNSGTKKFSITDSSPFTFAICDPGECPLGYSFVGDEGYGYIKLVMKEALGGGVRVKSLKTNDGEGNEYQLKLSYNEGIASAEPDPWGPEKFHVLYQNQVFQERHAQPIMVGYSEVNMEFGGSASTKGAGKSTYRFNNYLDTYQPYVSEVDGLFEEDVIYDGFRRFEIIQITERNSMYGNINSIEHRDNLGNLVEKVVYQYGDHIVDFHGVTEEVFYRQMTIDNVDLSGHAWIYSVFYKRHLQNFLKRKIVFRDGLQYTLTFDERDEITGLPVKTTVDDGLNGIKYQTNEQAYLNHPEMGSKMENTMSPRYNMLNMISTQAEEHKTFSSTLLTRGSHTDWKKDIKLRRYNSISNKYESATVNTLWRPADTYKENADGSTNTANWKRIHSNTLVGDNNQILEIMGPNQTFSAKKYGYNMMLSDRNQEHITAEVENCNYASFTHTSFESIKTVEAGVDHFDGEVIFDAGKASQYSSGNEISTINAHTGEHYVAVPASTSGTTGPRFVAITNNQSYGGETVEFGLHSGRTYRASVWVHEDSPSNAALKASYNGSSAASFSIQKNSSSAIQIGEWILLTLNIPVPDDYNSGGSGSFIVYLENPGGTGAAYFDDFRVHPVDATITAFVTDERRGLITHVINNENFYHRIEYDNAGNAFKTFQETGAGEKIRSKSSRYFVGH